VLVLALETSTAQSGVALATDEGVLAAATLGAERGRAHAEFLAPAIAFCLARAGAGVPDLTAVAVGLGPGLYTGMRVGIATAATLAAARGLPALGIASLDLLAFPVRHTRRLVCATVDARRGELFWAFYRPSPDASTASWPGSGAPAPGPDASTASWPGSGAPAPGPGGVQQVTEHRVGPVGKLAGELSALGEDVLCVGDGAAAHRAALESAGAEVAEGATDHPTAQALAELAVPRLRRGEGGPPATLRPVYLRRPDARINPPAPILVTVPRDGGEGMP